MKREKSSSETLTPENLLLLLPKWFKLLSIIIIADLFFFRSWIHFSFQHWRYSWLYQYLDTWLLIRIVLMYELKYQLGNCSMSSDHDQAWNKDGFPGSFHDIMCCFDCLLWRNCVMIDRCYLKTRLSCWLNPFVPKDYV